MARKRWSPRSGPQGGILEERLDELIEEQRRDTSFEGHPEAFGTYVAETGPWDDFLDLVHRSGEIDGILRMASALGITLDPRVAEEAAHYVIERP
jgi:hypothetical protein